MATVDTRLPLLAAQGGQVNLAELYQQKLDNDQRRQQMQFNERNQQLQERQLDLRERQMIDQLDAEKRKAAKAGAEDLYAAVTWADTPDKWAQVQRHISQFDPQLATIPFEQRELAVIKLGQMKDYLDLNEPKTMSVEAGGSIASVDPRSGQVRPLVVANPGNRQFGESASVESKTIGGQQFWRGTDGNWYDNPEEAGGSTGNGGGTFPGY
jgi:hypothetical protein